MHADNKKLRETVPRAGTNDFRQELDGNYPIEKRIAIAKFTFDKIQKMVPYYACQLPHNHSIWNSAGKRGPQIPRKTRYGFCTEFPIKLPIKDTRKMVFLNPQNEFPRIALSIPGPTKHRQVNFFRFTAFLFA